ncbi:hypothetical protein RJ639_026290, partial [Escallonia herrerae]
VVNCHESVIYILAPLRYATVYGCSDATIVLGAIGKGVRVEHCERVHVIVAAKRICIANCRECVFFLGVNQQPLIVGDNHKLQGAMEHTSYTWNEPVALGLVDPHDSLSHPAGVSDVQAESATRLDPDQFTNFLIPNWFGGESSGSTKDNPFPLPDVYMASQQRNHKNLGELKQNLRETQLEDSRKRELSSALHWQHQMLVAQKRLSGIIRAAEILKVYFAMANREMEIVGFVTSLVEVRNCHMAGRYTQTVIPNEESLDNLALMLWPCKRKDGASGLSLEPEVLRMRGQHIEEMSRGRDAHKEVCASHKQKSEYATCGPMDSNGPRRTGDNGRLIFNVNAVQKLSRLSLAGADIEDEFLHAIIAELP